MGVSSMEVRRVSELRAGDHIKWKRRLGYDHHAIVEWVNYVYDKVHVIEYQRPNEDNAHDYDDDDDDDYDDYDDDDDDDDDGGKKITSYTKRYPWRGNNVQVHIRQMLQC